MKCFIDNFDQSLQRSRRIQDLFHEQEIHPQLQQIETEKFGQNLRRPIDQSLRRPLKIHKMFHCLETHNFDHSLQRSLRIQDLFHKQEFHPQLQQIETEKFIES